MTAFLISGFQWWLKTQLLLTWPLPAEASSYLRVSLGGNYFLPASEVCNFGVSALFQAPTTLSGTSPGKSKCYLKGVLRLLLHPDFTSVIRYLLIYLQFPWGICSSRWTSLLKPGFLSILLISWENFSDFIWVKWQFQVEINFLLASFQRCFPLLIMLFSYYFLCSFVPLSCFSSPVRVSFSGKPPENCQSPTLCAGSEWEVPSLPVQVTRNGTL